MVKPWDTALIGDFLDFKNGLNKGKEFFGYGTPIVNYTDVYKNRGLKKADIRGKVCLTPDEIHRFDVRKNDVFFTRTSETPDEVGMSSVLLEDVENGVFSGFVLRGRPKNDMFVPEYCKYCFSTEAVRNAIITGGTYTTRALTNGKQLSAIELPVPPKPEQEAIAEALSDIDILIVNLEKLIAKKKTIKQGAMQELLTGKRRLPGFDDEWKTYELEELCDMFSGGTPNSKINAYYGGDIPWVSISDISDSGKYLKNTEKRLTIAGIEKSSARIYPAKTLLFAMYASIGKCCIAEQSVSSSQAILGIYNFHNVLCEFLYYYLTHNQRTFIEMGQMGTQSNLSKKIVQKILITLPSLDEQTAIVSFLSDVDNELDMLEHNLEKYCRIKQGMMSELLTGRIRLIDKEDA